ncbi:MAG: SspB family protein [Planktomarina sp.]
MTDTIEYGALMHDAMRELVRRVLEQIAQQGSLPGDHHFFITFDTLHPDVEIADWLSDRYPSEMTIVVQHWFDNLEVTDVGFAITLNFGDNPEPLYIPFAAIKTFVDPSVEFGLRFDPQDDDDDFEEASTVELVRDEPDLAEKVVADAAEPEAEKTSADVVSLDSFRKS